MNGVSEEWDGMSKSVKLEIQDCKCLSIMLASGSLLEIIIFQYV